MKTWKKCALCGRKLSLMSKGHYTCVKCRIDFNYEKGFEPESRMDDKDGDN